MHVTDRAAVPGCNDQRVRPVLALLVLLVLQGATACSGPGDEPKGSPSDSAQPAQSQSSSTASAGESSSSSTTTTDICGLLHDDEAKRLLGTANSDAAAGSTGGIPNCQWHTAGGRYIQVISAPASEWSRALPGLVRQVEASGAVSNPSARAKLKAGVKLIESNGTVRNEQACALFSQMLELQGQPPGTEHIVNVIPDRSNPQGVSAQICSSGRFTSLMVADPAGLANPLPIQPVADVVQRVHHRALS